jgi:hypothetical protein
MKIHIEGRGAHIFAKKKLIDTHYIKPILVISYLKVDFDLYYQITSIDKNHFYFIVSKHKYFIFDSLLLKSILSNSILLKSNLFAAEPNT